MNLIPTDGQGVLALNVFAVAPSRQQELLDCIQTAGTHAQVPGLRSMHLLRAVDGTQVINCMRWDSAETFREATATDPVIAATRDKVMAIVDGVRPVRYEIIPLVP